MRSSLVVALQFLTRIPVDAPSTAGSQTLATAAGAFPLVGALIGALVALATSVASAIVPELDGLAAITGLVVWRSFIGTLHGDGLADVADGMACLPDRERAFHAMSDPAVGAAGVTTLALALLTKFTLLSELVRCNAVGLLIAVCATGRWAIVFLPALVSYAPHGSASTLARNYFAEIGRWQHLGATIWLLAILAALAPVVTLVLPLAIVVCGLLALRFIHAFGGATGDCLGATVELVEISTLAFLVIVLNRHGQGWWWQSPLLNLS